jgi:hypothetical protein
MPQASGISLHDGVGFEWINHGRIAAQDFLQSLKERHLLFRENTLVRGNNCSNVPKQVDGSGSRWLDVYSYYINRQLYSTLEVGKISDDFLEG